jgi:hypothetical protein
MTAGEIFYVSFIVVTVVCFFVEYTRRVGDDDD